MLLRSDKIERAKKMCRYKRTNCPLPHPHHLLFPFSHSTLFRTLRVFVCLSASVWMSVCLSPQSPFSVCLFVRLFVCLSVFVCLSLSLSLCVCPSRTPHTGLPVCRSLSLSVCLCVCASLSLCHCCLSVTDT